MQRSGNGETERRDLRAESRDLRRRGAEELRSMGGPGRTGEAGVLESNATLQAGCYAGEGKLVLSNASILRRMLSGTGRDAWVALSKFT